MTTETKKTTYTSNFKQFVGKTFKIVDVYPHELFTFINGKPVTLVQIPVCDKEVLKSTDEEFKSLPKYSENPVCEYRQKEFWDWIMIYTKMQKVDKKAFQKVFAMKIELEEEMEAKKWDKENSPTEKNNVFTVTNIGASKIKDLIRMFSEEIPMIEYKWAEREAWDFEDSMKDELKWKFVKFKLGKGVMEKKDEKTGEMKTIQTTKYLFSEWKEFEVKEISLEDVPF